MHPGRGVCLPLNPMESSEAMRQAAFGEDGIPAMPFDYDELDQLARLVPLIEKHESKRPAATKCVWPFKRASVPEHGHGSLGRGDGLQRTGSGSGSAKMQLLPPKDTPIAALLNRAAGSAAARVAQDAPSVKAEAVGPFALMEKPAAATTAVVVEKQKEQCGEKQAESARRVRKPRLQDQKLEGACDLARKHDEVGGAAGPRSSETACREAAGPRPR